MYLYEIEKIKEEINDGLEYYIDYNNLVNEFQAGYNEGCFIALHILEGKFKEFSSTTNSDIEMELRKLLHCLYCETDDSRIKTRYQRGFDCGYKFILDKFHFRVQNILDDLIEKRRKVEI